MTTDRGRNSETWPAARLEGAKPQTSLKIQSIKKNRVTVCPETYKPHPGWPPRTAAAETGAREPQPREVHCDNVTASFVRG